MLILRALAVNCDESGSIFSAMPVMVRDKKQVNATVNSLRG